MNSGPRDLLAALGAHLQAFLALDPIGALAVDDPTFLLEHLVQRQIAVVGIALGQDLQPMAQIRVVTALEPIPSHRTRQAHQAAGTGTVTRTSPGHGAPRNDHRAKQFRQALNPIRVASQKTISRPWGNSLGKLAYDLHKHFNKQLVRTQLIIRPPACPILTLNMTGYPKAGPIPGWQGNCAVNICRVRHEKQN